MSSDSLITVQLEAWQATVKVTQDGFHPAEGVLSMDFGWVLGMFIAHSPLCAFHLLTNSLRLSQREGFLAVAFHKMWASTHWLEKV